MTLLNTRRLSLLVALSIAALIVWPRERADSQEAPTFDAASVEFFQTKVKPLLEARCFECHGPEAKKLKGGLSLASRADVLRGGDSGAAIVPGKPAESLLVKAINYVDFEMPPKSRLPEGEVAILTEWVNRGAPWSAGKADPARDPKPDAFPLAERKAKHWAWKPIAHVAPPKVRQPFQADPKVNTATFRDSDAIDQFILSKLEDRGLSHAAAADRRTLLRRAYFTLIGLPPTPAEADEFVADKAPTRESLARVVDRLLESPHFGERWARHWLDLVRYAETLGHEFDYPLAHAHQYRDYVIRALNADVPYDRFVVEHIAGDLLPRREARGERREQDKPGTVPSRLSPLASRLHPTDGYNESLLATGFWFLGEDKHAPVDAKAEQAARIDNQLDVFSKTFLGLTVACARCHDHKFDAIRTSDYYALAGFLQSSRRQTAYLDPHGKIDAAVAELKRSRSEQTSNPKIAKSREVPERTKQFEDFTSATFVDLQHPDESRQPMAENSPLAPRPSPIPHRWFATGWAFGDGPNRHGVVHSGELSPRLRGVLRSPTFTITHPQILYRLAGQNARVRLILDGYQMMDFSGLLFSGTTFEVKTDGKWVWHRQGGDLQNHLGRRAYIELIDDGDGWIACESIWFSNGGPEPVVQVSNLPATSPMDGQVGNLSHEIPDPMRAIAICDGNAVNEHVFIRGSHKNLGPEVGRRNLEAFDGIDQTLVDHEAGSGRLQLARRLIDAKSNPFVPRVAVNRVWHHLFGRGLVESVDNFGVLGKEPTHPELLDHLAESFVADGWSLKHLIRRIVLTNTWQMASEADPARSRSRETSEGAGDQRPNSHEFGYDAAKANELDPQNLWLHRAPIHRLESEAIRDSMLLIAGRLDRQSFGSSVPVHLTPFMQGRGRPGNSGPLDGDGRRSIYTAINRNFLSPLMLAFDTPIPFTTIGRRNVSNVPAQALILMNDPFVFDMSKRWAERSLKENADFTPEQRTERLYLDAFTRSPTAAEQAEAIAFLQEQAKSYNLPADGWSKHAQVWTDLCHVLFNVKEFVFVK